jgi:hypothetical protein
MNVMRMPSARNACTRVGVDGPAGVGEAAAGFGSASSAACSQMMGETRLRASSFVSKRTSGTEY